MVCLVAIWTNKMQKQHEVSSFQMLLAIAPVEGVILLILGPLMDYGVQGSNVYAEYAWTAETAAVVVATCALAVGVNGATFFLIGKTSPVSYQVVGHLKTVLVLAGGFVWFEGDASAATLCGVSLAFAGCLLYAWLKDREMKRELASKIGGG